MTIYQGQRSKTGTVVTADGASLDPCYDILSLSPSGFEWGYEGGGPGQLALAILCHHLNDSRAAINQFKEFRSNVISIINKDEWTLSSEDINTTLQAASHIVNVDMTLAELMDKVRWKG